MDGEAGHFTYGRKTWPSGTLVTPAGGGGYCRHLPRLFPRSCLLLGSYCIPKTPSRLYCIRYESIKPRDKWLLIRRSRRRRGASLRLARFTDLDKSIGTGTRTCGAADDTLTLADDLISTACCSPTRPGDFRSDLLKRIPSRG